MGKIKRVRVNNFLHIRIFEGRGKISFIRFNRDNRDIKNINEISIEEAKELFNEMKSLDLI